MATTLLQYNSNKRHFGLDFIRAIAIALVLLNHGSFFPSIFQPQLAAFSFFGVLGVELFFVLSGYLIGTILLRHYYHESSFNVSTIGRFWKRRWFRTLPAYFIVLLLCLITFPMLSEETPDLPFFRYFFFMQNFNAPIPPFFMESWSLSIEEWFYLALPVVFLLIQFFFTQKVRPVQLIFVFAGWILAATVLRYLLSDSTPLSNWNMQVRQVVLMRLDATAYGVLLACISLAWPRKLLRLSGYFLVCGLLGIVFSAAMYAWRIDGIAQHPLLATLFPTYLSISIAFLFPVLLKWEHCKHTFTCRIITRLSVISYAAYLLNYSLLLLPMSKLPPPSSALYAYLYTAIFWTISLIFANLFYSYIEKPLTDLRDRF